MPQQVNYIRWFNELTIDDIPLVGGKNASLGEMIRELAPQGVRIPNGFAITADAYRDFIKANDLEKMISDSLEGLKIELTAAEIATLDASCPTDIPLNPELIDIAKLKG